MSIFLLLLGKTLPLYINIILGYLAVRFLRVEKGGFAALLFYLIGPIVIFSATMSVRLDPTVLLLPIFFYLFCSALAFLTLRVFGGAWPDSTPNILAFTVGTGNTGYFGIVLALLLLEPPVADIFIFTVLASFFYEATTGFYVTAKGSFTARQSLAKVFRLPAFYAFLLALLLNLAGVRLPELISGYAGQFKVTFSILGMMLIGMGLAGGKLSDGFDPKFLTVSLAAKFILWPLSILAIIIFDRATGNLLGADLHRVMFLFSIVPLAGNTVTLALLLGVKPEKASLAVLVSTVVSIVYIPLALSFYEML